MSRVDVIIVNWNSRHLLARCLASLAGSGANPIVIDNASNDGSEAAAQASGATLICNPRNLGFAAACNIGAARASGDYLLFLNPDATMAADDLARLVEILRRAEPEGFGIAGPVLRDERGKEQPSCSEIPRLWDLIGRMIGLDRVGLARPALHLPAQSGAVGQVMGAAMLMPRKLFERLGGFDAGYFLYFEDLDLALRARELGSRSLFVREASAIHEGQGSSKQIKSRRLLLWLRSRHRFTRKNLGRGSAFLMFLLACLVEPFFRTANLFLSRRIREIPGALWAHLRFGLSAG